MKLIKRTVLTAALMTASGLLFAANANVSANADASVQTQQPSALQNFGHDLKDAAHKTGEKIEEGADKTKAFTKEKWQDAKDKTAELKQEHEEKSALRKQAQQQKQDDAQSLLGSKTAQSKAHIKEKKQLIKSELDKPHNTGFNGKAQAQLTTPAGSAEIHSGTDAAVSAQ